MGTTIPPWLGHLRRDRRGIPVPYINLWGAEDVDRLTIAHDQHVGRPGVFLDDAAELMPDFTRQNMGRQRECMMAGLCQVCARPVPWRRRLLVLASMSVETVEVDGRMQPVITEPWLDARCAEFALTHCPDLIRRGRDEKLDLVAITAREQTTMTVSTGWIEGPLQALSERVQPAMWVKVILRHVDIRAEVPAP